MADISAGAEPPERAAASSAALGETIAAAIRNGLSNGPIAQSAAAWEHLNTRLGEIVAAILKEI